MYATSYGQFAPCCSSKKFNFKSPEEYWNSEELSKIRQLVLNNQWPDECNECKQLTDIGVFCDRDLYDRLHTQVGQEDNPLVLDLRPGNRCNLKCRMCSPHGSDLIEKEVDDNKELEQFYEIENTNKGIVDLSNYISNIDVKWLKVLGGEPSIDNEVYDVLNNLVINNKTNLTVMITTNGTNYNIKFYSLLEKFSNVTLKFSVDGAGPAYNYIRTNANWAKTSTIIEKILKANKFNKYIISPVIQPYNLPTFIDFLDWLLYLYNKEYKFLIAYHHSVDPKTNICVLEEKHLNYCKELINLWAEDKDINFLNYIDFKSLTTLLNTEHNPIAKKNFINFNNSLDRIRKTDISSIHPLLKNYK